MASSYKVEPHESNSMTTGHNEKSRTIIIMRMIILMLMKININLKVFMVVGVVNIICRQIHYQQINGRNQYKRL